jgi:hypothetical protein
MLGNIVMHFIIKAYTLNARSIIENCSRSVFWSKRALIFNELGIRCYRNQVFNGV